MFTLPKTTEFGAKVPKVRFYENIDISPSVKRCFVDEIGKIVWKYKIAPSTMNLQEGKNVNEIEVFEIFLNTGTLNEGVLTIIDRNIPYHLLYLLRYEDKVQAWIGYKEEAKSGTNAFKVSKYFHTDWMTEEELPLSVDGLDMDSVYENFVRQIAGDELETGQGDETLKDSVEKAEEKEKILKEIEKLKVKMKREKQLNRKMEINDRIKALMKDLKGI